MKTLTFGLLLLLLGNAQAQPSVTACIADEAAHAVASAYGTHWREAVLSSDPSRLGALYGDTAVLMPPSEDTLIGNQAIASYLLDDAAAAGPADAQIDYVSCERHGDTLHVAGVWGTTDSRVPTGTWKTGNLLRILERDAAGHWVASYEIWN